MDRGRDENQEFLVPDLVKQFVVYFYRHIMERNVSEIWSMYDVSFHKLSERYFKTSSWPPVQFVSHLVDNDHVFCLLYQEMYHRHLYSKTMPTLEQRARSWDTYVDLFQIICGATVNMRLPTGWLWDMVDEFCYQAHSYCQFRGKASRLKPDDFSLLQRCEAREVWSMEGVHHFLEMLIERSGVVAMLEAEGDKCVADIPESVSNVLPLMGYFALLGLSRMKTLLGDYEGALRALYPVNVHERKSPMTARISSCHIALLYYSGFCYLMLERYTDAARCFNSVLFYIARVKQGHMRPQQFEQVLRKNEQVYALLALTVALCPRTQKGLEEQVAQNLVSKHKEDLAALARGEEAPLEVLFAYGCPKFVAGGQIDLTQSRNPNTDVHKAQLQRFLDSARRRKHLPMMKQYLALYSTIPLAKLAKLMDMDENELRGVLAGYQDLTTCTTYKAGNDMLSGEPESTADLVYQLGRDDAGRDIVIVQETRQPRKHNDVLLRHINKFKEITKDLQVAARGVNPAQA
ncbi:unnamed protein product [Pedinophyceae sp. YPF-701]|nr:unnamed protein product [Pedinophyceae sp. YPF-701]